ncbi:MAG: tetratricopeptide repeat protein [Chitinophagales bacterium]
MKALKLLTLLIFLSRITFSQIIYESPLGFKLSFDSTWKKLPKEVLQQKMRDVQNFLDYKDDISFDACYQKIGNADMDYPYILFKNVYLTTTNSNEINEVQEYFKNKAGFDSLVQTIVNGKFDYELKIGESYYDKQNNILFFTYDMGLSIKGNLVGMFAYYFGKNGSLFIYCYSYKDEFKYDQQEFLDVIYSIEDKGMKSEMDVYQNKHDVAVKFYNDAKLKSAAGDYSESIKLYTKAIENYPVEDNNLKAEAYYNRGINKRNLNNFTGAISDYSEAIKLRPDYVKAFNNRGFAKMQIDDYSGAISDFTSAIKYDNYNTEFTNMAFGNRGIAKLAIGQDGCADLRKAMELGNKSVTQIYNEFCK